MNALSFSLGPTLEIVLSGADARDVAPLAGPLRGRFLPDKVLLFRPAGEAGDAVVRLAPYAGPMLPVKGNAAAYVCRNYACDAPVSDPEKLARRLAERGVPPAGKRTD
jgi:hypothetical protein